jgi:hypothetical protein
MLHKHEAFASRPRVVFFTLSDYYDESVENLRATLICIRKVHCSNLGRNTE